MKITYYAKRRQGIRTDCCICGTKENVESINYGEYGQGKFNQFNICPICKRRK